MYRSAVQLSITNGAISMTGIETATCTQIKSSDCADCIRSAEVQTASKQFRRTSSAIVGSQAATPQMRVCCHTTQPQTVAHQQGRQFVPRRSATPTSKQGKIPWMHNKARQSAFRTALIRNCSKNSTVANERSSPSGDPDVVHPLHVPDSLRRAVATIPTPSLSVLSGRSPQIKAANSLHEVAPYSIYGTTRCKKGRCLGRGLLHFEQPYASVVPYASGTL